MKQIKDKDFKEFKLSDIFQKAIRGNAIRLQIIREGNMPVIAASGVNQGIAGYYELDKMYENKITISCNGVGSGSTFYHNYPFYITGDAIVLIEKEEYKQYFNNYVSLYLTTTINAKFTKVYTYEDKCTADKALQTTILLPITKEGNPDWHYMETFMERKIKQAKQRLSYLRNIEKTI